MEEKDKKNVKEDEIREASGQTTIAMVCEVRTL